MKEETALSKLVTVFGEIGVPYHKIFNEDGTVTVIVQFSVFKFDYDCNLVYVEDHSILA